MNQKYISVSKEKLAKIIILVDRAETLSEEMENNNQEVRILLHSLISDIKLRGNLKYRENLLE